MKVEFGQVVSQIICFLLMFWILKRYGWKPILTVIEERKIRIKAEFEELRNQKKEIDHLIEDYKHKLAGIDEKAQVKIEEAIKQGKEASLKIQEEAHRQAKIIIIRAQEDLQKEVIKAKIQLKNEIIKITLDATEKILQENIDPKKNEELIASFVNNIGENK